jgi:hypothetical protein
VRVVFHQIEAIPTHRKIGHSASIKIELKLEDEWEGVDIEQVLQEGPSPQGDSLCAIEAYTLANQDMEALKDEQKSESTMSDLDDMWYTGDK